MHRRRAALVLGLAAAVALVLSLAAGASISIVQIAADPFTNASSQHKTIVEPDTFGWGSTIVAAAQFGRFTDGGASDIGWATSTNAGSSWTSGVMPAITAFTKALAVDEAPHGVRVNSVSPGNVYTPLWQEAIDAAPDPQRCRADGEAAQVMGRMGTAEEVGRLCLFIAAEATFTTGVDHIISGGAELGYGQKSRD